MIIEELIVLYKLHYFIDTISLALSDFNKGEEPKPQLASEIKTSSFYHSKNMSTLQLRS